MKNRSVLVAVDLDQTLIYSDQAVGRLSGSTNGEEVQLRQVEEHPASGARSYIAAELPAQLDALRASATVVPVTTRSCAQFERIAPLGSMRFEHTVCSNGAILLVGGEPDATWAAEVSGQLAFDEWRVEEAAAFLDGFRLESKAARIADGVFCYLVVEHVDAAAAEIQRIHAELDTHGWSAFLSGRKLYALPALLTKAGAVTRLANRLEASAVVAIGDSVLDLSMLASVDYSIAPAHAELAVREVAEYITPSWGPRAAIEALAAAAAWITRLRERDQVGLD